MGHIVMSTNMTLDGVTEDPAGNEGTERGGWAFQVSDEDWTAWNKVVHDEARGVAAYLLGARSYEWFAARWVGRDGDQADLFSAKHKYVVRTSEGRSDWGPTTVLAGDVVDEVAKLKERTDGDIVIYASYQLARTLLDARLVDEIRVFVFPRVAGGGGRLFLDLQRSTALQLVGVDQVGDELVRLRYDVDVVS